MSNIKLLSIGLGILLLISVISMLVINDMPYSVSNNPISKIDSFPENSQWLKSLSASTCSPDTGYTYCIKDSYRYGSASAYVKIQTTNILGKKGYGLIEGKQSRYYVGEVYQNVKFSGDKFYAKRGQTTWGNPCMTGGCTGDKISSGKYVIATAPAKNPPFVYYIAYDYSSSGGDWCWTAIYHGWVGTPPNYNFYVINCYDNGDCSSNEYCDKSGNWDTWACKIDPCTTMPPAQDICDGFELWSQKCVIGEYQKDKLIETNFETCGCVLPVEMPNVCIGFELWSQKQEQVCIDKYVPDKLIESKSTQCGYVCTENETQTFTCDNGEEIIISVCINNDWVITDNNPERTCLMLPLKSLSLYLVSIWDWILSIFK